MHTNKKFLAIAGALALFNTAHAAGPNLLTNGNFEDISAFTPNSQDTMSLLPGATELHGWNVINSAGLDLAWLGPRNPWGLPASQGSYFLDLAGYHGTSPFSGISQTIATKAGYVYSVSFDLGYWGTSPSALQAMAGNAVQSFTNNAVSGRLWERESFTFKANSSNTTLTFLGLTASNGNFLGLDNVSASVVAVPEPETYALMLAGLGFFGLWRRKQLFVR